MDTVNFCETDFTLEKNSGNCMKSVVVPENLQTMPYKNQQSSSRFTRLHGQSFGL